MNDAFKHVLAILIVVIFAGTIGVWLYRPPTGSEGAMAILNSLIGIEGSAFVAVVQYFFGSSSASQGKDAVISQMATNAVSGTPPVVPLPDTPAVKP
jgi:hypothetical protein